MQNTIHNHYLRNPVFILAAYIVLLLPEFAFFCRVSLPFQAFWSDFSGCGQAFIWQSFIGKSIWSLILIILIFEIFLAGQRMLKLDTLPYKPRKWFMFQGGLLVVLLAAFIVYIFFSWLLTLAGGSESLFYATGAGPLSTFKKVMFIGFVAINANLLLQLRYFRKAPLAGQINVHDGLGERTISLEEIKWFEKKGRHYFACTGEGAFRVGFNLQTLEKSLSGSQFVRINRAVIANIAAIKDYAYWENEKYILRMQADTEFVVNRKRMQSLKVKLKNRK